MTREAVDAVDVPGLVDVSALSDVVHVGHCWMMASYDAISEAICDVPIGTAGLLGLGKIMSSCASSGITKL